jgi:hypothetical protein
VALIFWISVEDVPLIKAFGHFLLLFGHEVISHSTLFLHYGFWFGLWFFTHPEHFYILNLGPLPWPSEEVTTTLRN